MSAEVEIFGPALEEARRAVEFRLAEYLRLDSDCPVRLRQAMEYSLLSPGKRLRPMLVLAATEACGGSWERAVPAACSIELIHNYSLIHDDLPAMDDDDLRRGQPSCHIAFDEATAILAGDALIPLAFEILARDIAPAEVAMRCVAELAVAAGPQQLVGGQLDDLTLMNAIVDIEALERIHRRKTGALFTAALRIGCFLADGTDSQLEAVTKYGKNLGLAFQVTDDLLDLCGDESRIGKRVGKDSPAGKQTYPKLLGADESRLLAAELRDNAIEAILPLGNRANDLIRFAQFVVERNF